MRESAYQDVLSAWREYLQRYNNGRGVVFIGHSQGTFVLRRLLAEEVEKMASQRRRVISALLMGGNVLVKQGSDRGGDFKKLRACRSRNQTGCVVASRRSTRRSRRTRASGARTLPARGPAACRPGREPRCSARTRRRWVAGPGTSTRSRRPSRSPPGR
jgi:hypothetical protein